MADFGYRARIPVSVVPVQVRREGGVGAAIGEGLQQLGQTGQRIAAQDAQVKEEIANSEARIEEIEKNRWRASTAATLLTRYSEVQLELDAKVEEVRKKSPPGAPGHEEAIRAVSDEVMGRFLSEVPDDPELQNRFRPMAANLSARTTLAERSWEQQARVKHIADSYGQWQTAGTSRLYSAPSGENFTAFLSEGEAAIDLLDLDETTKAAMRTDLREKGTRALFTGLLDSGRQDVVKAAIEAGDFDGVLDDQAKSLWLGKVETANRIAANEAAAQASEARRAALEQAKLLKVRMENGDDVSPGEANDAIAAMRAAGVPDSEILEFGYLVEDTTVAQSLRGYSTPELQARRAALQSKMDAGEASDDDVREAGLIDGQLKGRTTKASETLGQLWKGTPEQKVEALRQARAMPAGIRGNATAQVSVKMQLLTQLGERNQVLAVQGEQLRKDRPDDFLPKPSGTYAKGRDEVDAIVREYLGPTINDIGGVRTDLTEAALDLMAGNRASHGRDEGWHKGDFLAALRGLTGGTRRPDGTWQGGIGTVEGFKVELPATVSEQEFARAYARQTFPGAQYANGTAAKPADIRRHFRPVYLETDSEGRAVYVLQGASGLLMAKDGPFKLNVWGKK